MIYDDFSSSASSHSSATTISAIISLPLAFKKNWRLSATDLSILRRCFDTKSDLIRDAWSFTRSRNSGWLKPCLLPNVSGIRTIANLPNYRVCIHSNRFQTHVVYLKNTSRNTSSVFRWRTLTTANRTWHISCARKPNNHRMHARRRSRLG